MELRTAQEASARRHHPNKIQQFPDLLPPAPRISKEQRPGRIFSFHPNTCCTTGRNDICSYGQKQLTISTRSSSVPNTIRCIIVPMACKLASSPSVRWCISSLRKTDCLERADFHGCKGQIRTLHSCPNLRVATYLEPPLPHTTSSHGKVSQLGTKTEAQSDMASCGVCVWSCCQSFPLPRNSCMLPQ